MPTSKLLTTIAARIDTPPDTDVELIVREVLHALAYTLPEEERRLLADAIPGELGAHLTEGRIEYDPFVDEHLFIGYLMTEHQTTGYWDKTAGGEDVLASVAGEEIERRARAVLQSVGAVVPGAVLETVCEALPPVLRDWFRGDGDPTDSR